MAHGSSLLLEEARRCLQEGALMRLEKAGMNSADYNLSAAWRDETYAAPRLMASFVPQWVEAIRDQGLIPSTPYTWAIASLPLEEAEGAASVEVELLLA